ncbi:MAG TPA: ATPase, partial [Ruminococcaceae bacterium]|nr:ATPase [Oscillospiraceae bacterium]
CDAFLFYRVNRYDIKGKEYLKTQNKYYAADMGLRNAAIHYRQIEITHIIENLVYLELLRRDYIVDIGKNREKEIDFVARELGGRQYYIQVSYTIQDEAVKEREISAFHKLDDGYKKILITMDRNPLSNLENGYRMMYLLDFLLNENALEKA